MPSLADAILRRVRLVVFTDSVNRVDEEEKKLLAAAQAIVREGAQKLLAISEEAKLLYRQRMIELEECRHSLDKIGALLNAEAPPSESDTKFDDAIETRASFLGDESALRKTHGELAEKAYHLRRAVRLMGTAARHLEEEGSRLLSDADGIQPRDEDEPESGSHDRIIQAHEQERLRLAREIHDGPAQILANAIFELEYFERLFDRDPTAAKDALVQLKGDLREGLTEVRRFIFDLRPPALSEMGLFVALRGYLQEFEKHFGIAVAAELPATEERLPATVELSLFRIVQEALQNAQKHASASRINVWGEMDSLGVRLSVEDDGRGFDPTEVANRRSKNLGLISMRERAGLIGAGLQITSVPGQGTKIGLTVPLEVLAE